MTSLRMGLSSEKMTRKGEHRKAGDIRAAKPGPRAQAASKHETGAHHPDPHGRHEPHGDLKFVLHIRCVGRQENKQSARGNAETETTGHAGQRLRQPVPRRRTALFRRPHCVHDQRVTREASPTRTRSSNTPINGHAVMHAMAAVNTIASEVAGCCPLAPITNAAMLKIAASVLKSRGRNGARSQRWPGAAR